jgi:hypothetical protein
LSATFHWAAPVFASQQTLINQNQKDSQETLLACACESEGDAHRRHNDVSFRRRVAHILLDNTPRDLQATPSILLSAL